MNATATDSLTPRELVRLLVKKRTLWAAPALACGLMAAAYSLVMPRYWEASQALVLRQETAGSQGQAPGKFADLYEMRTLQETILELTKSREVVVATIKAVDQRLYGSAKAPTAEDIEKFRNRMKMLPPDGGEFGKSEVFYFCLQDRSRERAIALVGELCQQLDAGLKDLRSARAEGLAAELEEQHALAAKFHQHETARLKAFEADVGADLGELRMLHSASSGQSDLRQEAVQLEADARKFETQGRELKQLLAMLRAAEDDPQQLVATPNSLLESQPALRRLKDGLVDAQLATARLSGTRSADHPRVRAAVEGEKKIRSNLHRELVTAIRGAEAEVRLSQDRVATTRARLTNVEGRLSRLAERRAEYSNRVAAVDNSRITLDRARQNLSTARASLAAARSGSLVTRIDRPETGPYPAGPGRTVIAGAGAVGGLMLGLGLVFLTTGAAPVTPTPAALHTRSNREPLASVQTEPIEDCAAPLERPLPIWPPSPPDVGRAATVTGTTTIREASIEPAPMPAVDVLQPLRPTSDMVAPTRADIEAPRGERPSVQAPTRVTAPDDSITAPQVWAEPAPPSPPAPARVPQIAEPVQRIEPRAPVTAATEVEGNKTAAIELEQSVTVKSAPAPRPTPAAAVTIVAPTPAQPPLPPRVAAVPPNKKAPLPTAPGTLPTPGGMLPPLVTAPALGGMSLQEALQAAREAQR